MKMKRFFNVNEAGLTVVNSTDNRISALLIGDQPVKGSHCLYQIMIGEAVYVGRTGNLNERLNAHLSKIYWAHHKTLRLYQFLNSVNPTGVTVAVVNCDTKEEASEMELFAIDWYRANNWNVLNERRGAALTDEEKERNREKAKSRTCKTGPAKRPVLATKDSVVHFFPSIVAAGKALNLYPANIGLCLRGKLHTTGGFKFTDAPKEKKYA